MYITYLTLHSTLSSSESLQYIANLLENHGKNTLVRNMNVPRLINAKSISLIFNDIKKNCILIKNYYICVNQALYNFITLLGLGYFQILAVKFSFQLLVQRNEIRLSRVYFWFWNNLFTKDFQILCCGNLIFTFWSPLYAFVSHFRRFGFEIFRRGLHCGNMYHVTCDQLGKGNIFIKSYNNNNDNNSKKKKKTYYLL